MKKKHEGLITFNHKGTDIMVKPSVHNILKGLTEEVQKLRPLEGKLKLAERNQKTTERELEREKQKVKFIQKHLSEARDEIRKVKSELTQEKIKQMDPKEILSSFADALDMFGNDINSPNFGADE